MTKETLPLPIDDPKVLADRLDEQIDAIRKVTDFEIREYPIEVLVDKFTKGLETDEAEVFIPDYQREFIWTARQQSRFIESLLMNLPVPYMFVADVPDGPRAGHLEIIDGSQRMRTLVNFLQNKLTLEQLQKVDLAIGLKLQDFSPPGQLRFKRKTVRVIELTRRADNEARREMFDRLNSGGTKLESMETRRGTLDGSFLRVIEACAKMPLFKILCPVSKALADRAEHVELVLRYFAYCDNYAGFTKRVDSFLTDYLKARNQADDRQAEEASVQEFETMLAFVQGQMPNGFRKSPTTNTVARIRFECLSVGTTLALREQPALVPINVNAWLESEEFIHHTRSDASNSRPKVVNRIHFVRDNLIGRPVQYDGDTAKVEASANLDAPPEAEQLSLLV
ncbi:DUF262 domain-containing protein [Polaromonas naphthalenivorans]|uniref:GmrSD restriction endonucleases N-terminal domain-containing protein n=1 Tax=Polaromonas naphthalenivorans (strain CJ2) TaxID=365044 RepID=A1VX45_POLNA|nr:DUF262 domain-containing protein [Polaromonas naphthalenivorans]ABM40223.1 protein of unknown function DUF262 [Polaromonas naphthalenivorans CJ2]